VRNIFEQEVSRIAMIDDVLLACLSDQRGSNVGKITILSQVRRSTTPGFLVRASRSLSSETPYSVAASTITSLLMQR
jgi:hypothetical protein